MIKKPMESCLILGGKKKSGQPLSASYLYQAILGDLPLSLAQCLHESSSPLAGILIDGFKKCRHMHTYSRTGARDGIISSAGTRVELVNSRIISSMRARDPDTSNLLGCVCPLHHPATL